jgi:aryl-alcohol dehydrogenase-like predicted oxidoreductase
MYRTLGRKPLQVSEIGFGCGGTAGLMTGNDFELQICGVRRALEHGINYFDTAAAYGDGRSEENLGRVLNELGADPIVATKVTLEWADLDAGSVRRSIEGSLHRLKRDRLDVVHLHNRVGIARAAKSSIGSGALLTVDDIIGAGGAFEALDDFRRSGHIGTLGCCAFGGDRSSIEAVIDSRLFESVLVNYSLLNVSAWRSGAVEGAKYEYGRVAERASIRGMGIVALRILEAGVLSGPMTDLHARANTPESYRHILKRLAALRFPSDRVADLAELAVRFVLSNSSVSTALVGFSSIAQIDAAVAYAKRGMLAHDLFGNLDEIRLPMDARAAP